MRGRAAEALRGGERRNKPARQLVPQPEAVQVGGIMLVILAMLAAEFASLALSLKPGSELLWWLNLQVFRGMNAAYASLAARYPLDYHLTIPILLGLIALTASAYRRRQRFALGMLSNAAFVWCGFTVYIWYNFKTPLATAGIGDALHQNFEGWVLLAHIALASLFGFLVTQLLYWRAAASLVRGFLCRIPRQRRQEEGRLAAIVARCRHAPSSVGGVPHGRDAILVPVKESIYAVDAAPASRNPGFGGRQASGLG